MVKRLNLHLQISQGPRRLMGLKIPRFVSSLEFKICERLSTHGSSNQYLIFQPVTTKDLTEIDRERGTIGTLG
jgi:hypothetical protein